MDFLADRLNYIIKEQGISKREFAARLGITPNYIYILTGSCRRKANHEPMLSRTLANLIALEFGYDVEWIMSGNSQRQKGEG